LEGKPIGDNWIMVTQTEYDSFRIDPKSMLSLSSNSPTLKVEKLIDSQHCSIANQARSQDVSKVLEPSYIPTTANEQVPFNATASEKSNLPPGDICGVISKASKGFVNKCEYVVSKHDHTSNMLLVDHGVSGGVNGNDVCVLKTFHNVNIIGIDNHHLTDVPIGTVGCVVSIQKDPGIVNMHPYGLLGKNSSIHSTCQLEPCCLCMLLVVINRLRLWMDMLYHWLFKLDFQGYTSALTQTLNPNICLMCSLLLRMNGTLQ
jgi:hypothetical protein